MSNFATQRGALLTVSVLGVPNFQTEFLNNGDKQCSAHTRRAMKKKYSYSYIGKSYRRDAAKADNSAVCVPSLLWRKSARKSILGVYVCVLARCIVRYVLADGTGHGSIPTLLFVHACTNMATLR